MKKFWHNLQSIGWVLSIVMVSGVLMGSSCFASNDSDSKTDKDSRHQKVNESRNTSHRSKQSHSDTRDPRIGNKISMGEPQRAEDLYPSGTRTYSTPSNRFSDGPIIDINSPFPESAGSGTVGRVPWSRSQVMANPRAYKDTSTIRYFEGDWGTYWSVSDSNLRHMQGKKTIADVLSETHYTESPRYCYHHHRDGRYYYENPTISIQIGYYYPYYAYSRPSWIEIYVSPYASYRSIPPYILANTVVVLQDGRIPQYSDNDSVSVQKPAYQAALDNIRNSWLNKDPSLLFPYLMGDRNVAIYQNGQYQYSMNPRDFRLITTDTMDSIRTENFEYTQIVNRGWRLLSVVASHTFVDNQQVQHHLYVSYLMDCSGGTWRIIAAGTSNSDKPIE